MNRPIQKGATEQEVAYAVLKARLKPFLQQTWKKKSVAEKTLTKNPDQHKFQLSRLLPGLAERQKPPLNWHKAKKLRVTIQPYKMLQPIQMHFSIMKCWDHIVGEELFHSAYILIWLHKRLYYLSALTINFIANIKYSFTVHNSINLVV